MRLQPRQNLLSGLIASCESENSIDCCRFRGSGGHGRTDPVGENPDYRTLFSNLSDQDGGAIVSQLTQMNIPYRFSEASGAIEVPADKVHELRLAWRNKVCPKAARSVSNCSIRKSLVSASSANR